MKDITFAILIIGGLFVGLFGLSLVADLITCNSKYASFEHKYGVWTECQIKVGDKWVPADSYYVKEDIKEQK